MGPRAAQFSVPASRLLTHTCTSHPCTQICTPASALSTAQSIAVSSPTQVILIFTLVVLPVLGWLCCYCSTSVLSLFFHVFHCRTISLASLAFSALSYYLSPLLPAGFLNNRLFCFLTEDFTASTRSFFFSLALSFMLSLPLSCGNLSPHFSTLVHQLSQHVPSAGWLCCYCSTSVLSLFFHVFYCRTISLASLAFSALSYYLSPLLPAGFLNNRLFCFLTEDFTASTRSFFFSLALSFMLSLPLSCGNLSPHFRTLVHQLSQHVPSARDDRFPFLP